MEGEGMKPGLPEIPGTIKDNVTLREISDIAERLVDQKQYDEAIVLYELAHKFYPDSIAVQLNLARIRGLKQRRIDAEQAKAEEEWRNKREESDVMAQHFISLARIYIMRGQQLKALELIELARRLNHNIAELHRLSAQILYEQINYPGAMKALEEARRLDPFNDSVPHLQGRIALDQKDYDGALNHIIDAYLLSGGDQSKYRELYSEQIRTIAAKLAIPTEDLEHLLHDRKDYLNEFVEQLQLKKGQITFEVGPTDMDLMLLQLPKIEQARQSVLGLAVFLRRYPPFNVMTDDQILSIAKQSERLIFETNEKIFTEAKPLENLYLVIEGLVHVTKDTPFGTLKYAAIHPGQLFGEMDFIDRLQASADASATRPTTVIAISRTGLSELIIQDKLLGIQLYWHFWKLLAERIRLANDKAHRFFQTNLEQPGGKKERTGVKVQQGEVTHVDIEQKIALLKEKGLSSSELKLLATFSQEERYRKDQFMFHEGDQGDCLYIILDGQVRISKFIPGVGEEALAILDRGEFFGEMALVDGSPRSADAAAHTDSLTVLSINQRVLTDILSRDPDSSLRFLKILCRMMSQRLREINLKIYQWHMMAGIPIMD